MNQLRRKTENTCGNSRSVVGRFGGKPWGYLKYLQYQDQAKSPAIQWWNLLEIEYKFIQRKLENFLSKTPPIRTCIISYQHFQTHVTLLLFQFAFLRLYLEMRFLFFSFNIYFAMNTENKLTIAATRTTATTLL